MNFTPIKQSEKFDFLNVLWLMIVLMIIITTLFLFSSNSKNANEETLSNTPTAEILETINFCGIKYQMPKIIIDGVNVVKRIAEIATNDKQDYCPTIIGDKKPGSTLSVAIEGQFLILNNQPFSINTVNKKIFIEGSDSIFFGYLK